MMKITRFFLAINIWLVFFIAFTTLYDYCCTSCPLVEFKHLYINLTTGISVDDEIKGDARGVFEVKSNLLAIILLCGTNILLSTAAWVELVRNEQSKSEEAMTRDNGNLDAPLLSKC